MIKSIIPCVTEVKSLRALVGDSTHLIRQVGNKEREKMERIMKDWEKSKKVRELFNKIASVQLSALHLNLKLVSQASETNDKIIQAEFDNIWLEENQNWITIELKDGKEIVKAGKLHKLVEKLCSHKPVDPDYTNAFLLTHHSFTTSQEFLDLLIKRYDITFPYGMDQKMFDLFLNQKIIPIRLRYGM
jgi:hypothetical protein